MNDIFYPVAHRDSGEIEALKSRYKLFDEALIPGILKEVNLTAVSWTTPASWSTSHVIYIVVTKERPRPVILRTNIGWGNSETYMLIEKLITDQVAILGVPVNRILHVDVSRSVYPFDYQIQDALEGTDIEDTFHGTRTEYDQMSFDIGRYVAMWGDLSFSEFGRFDEDAALTGKLTGTKQSMYEYILVRLDEDVRFLADHDVLGTGKADRIRRIFDEYKPVMSVKTGTLVQYDLADHNIMFDGSSTITGIFDWEAAVVGDPMLDLASAPTWKTFHPREEKLIEGYKSFRDLPTFFREKMDVYRLRTMLWKMVYAIRAGILNDARMKKFQDSLVPFSISAS